MTIDASTFERMRPVSPNVFAGCSRSRREDLNRDLISRSQQSRAQPQLVNYPGMKSRGSLLFSRLLSSAVNNEGDEERDRFFSFLHLSSYQLVGGIIRH